MSKQLIYLYIFLLLLTLWSCGTQEGYEFIPTTSSQLTFNNTIPEDRTINILSFEYLYNGGGVGAADFNKDGKTDLYFAGNMVSNRLFLNKEGFEFIDITEQSGTAAAKQWSNGISIVDINNDTWPDIYVSVSALSFGAKPKNLLFINQGNNSEGIPTFKEAAEAYGIASDRHSRHAAFFDYDRDGDLDLYVLNNIIDLTDPTSYRRKVKDGSAIHTDQLYQNIGNNEYKEVGKEAGILIEGYGLGIAIGDVNQDGWPDIYVANDYITNDLLYINQQDGTFKNEIAERTKLQSKFSMGVSLSDFNNDGASDILVLDMLSATNERLKRHVKASNYNNRRNNQVYKYQEQVARNTFQQNQGNGYFGEIGFHAGIYASDWSWSPLTADFNNDGLLDVYVTNGYPKDITELDFVDYRLGANLALNKKKIFDLLTAEKVPNCLFLNQGDMRFEEQAKTWQLDKPSFSNGAIYADFDQNGQLDIVVNNINENAYLLKNNGFDAQQYLQVQFSEKARYSKAIGAKVYVFTEGQQQFQEYHLNKSYLSSVAPFLHFGVGAASAIDSLVVEWSNGDRVAYPSLPTNQVYTIPDVSDSKLQAENLNEPIAHSDTLFTARNTTLVPKNILEDGFSYQRTLPFSYSHLGPVIAAMDIDKDDKIELISIDENSEVIKIYDPENDKTEIVTGLIDRGVNGLLAVDMNGDTFTDLVFSYGGYHIAATNLKQSLQILFNDGTGGFSRENGLQYKLGISAGVIRGNDIDQDGDIDLFIGGTLSQNNFPIASESYLLINDIKKDGATILDKSKLITIGDIGIVMDALWTDVTDNGAMELMIAAHLKPIQILAIKDGELAKNTTLDISNNVTGFWNSIHALDYDNDGDTDYLLANIGTNTPLSNGDSPITIAYQDQDDNGSIDVFTGFRFNKESAEVPFEFRNEVIAQIPTLKKRFVDYKSYSNTSFQNFLQTPDKEKMDQEVVVESVKHQLLENEDGQLIMQPLPTATQLSPIFGWTTTSLNEDHLLDVIASTNLSYSREFWGTYAAADGFFLAGQKDSTLYKVVPNVPRIKGDGRALITLLQDGKRSHFINLVNAPMKEVISDCLDCFFYAAKSNEQAALLTFKDGLKRKVEFYYGNGFRAQATRGVLIEDKHELAKFEIFSVGKEGSVLIDLLSLN